MDFQSVYRQKVQSVNLALEQLLKEYRDCPPAIHNAMKYSLMAGGKRLRPVLFLEAYELTCRYQHKEPETALVEPMACALEMIHTYSLIHDDLPAMDNDDYRRGKRTNHKVFGEAMAILAGDGLLNLAYEVMLDHMPKDGIKHPGYPKAMSVLAHSAGIFGMIGGQVVDMQSENMDCNRSDDTLLDYIHTHKTEALITGSLKAGALAADGDEFVTNTVVAYGKAYGMAFQITDDILDVTGDPSVLGKLPGSDEKQGKLTYPARFGLELSGEMAKKYVEQAVSTMNGFGSEGEFLRQLAFSVRNRNQ
ncbi:polyprenyl synthetase family protein [Eubacteriales bacterium mix99]|jgi:geranylgeranyl diphosphate synthase type II|nr:hypothetical protein [Clostridiales bacterium]